MPDKMLIAVSHLGYLPDQEKKQGYVIHPDSNTTFQIHAVGTQYVSGGKNLSSKQTDCPVVLEGSIRLVKDVFGDVGIIDFSSLHAPGLYQITVGHTRSHPFFIRSDVYIRTAQEAFFYSHIQRCGCEIPGWHAACHLDDGIRRDTGEHIDTAGGWHDAGDLRKWMDHTMWQAIGMLWLKKRWHVVWSSYAEDDILDEMKWGNLYYHKMQDPVSGLVWHDVGGDESCNYWTDNIPGTADDRLVTTSILPHLQWKYAWIQFFAAAVFSDKDPAYSHLCMQHGHKAYEAARMRYTCKEMNTLHLVFALLAATELCQITGHTADRSTAEEMLHALLQRQETEYAYSQDTYRGFFYNEHAKQDIYCDWWQSCLLPFSLANAADVLSGQARHDAEAALRLFADNYLLPLSQNSIFGVLPVKVTLCPNTHDTYHILAGEIRYRFFLPCMSSIAQEKQFAMYGQGTSPHLLGHAAVLLHCWRRFGREDYRTAGLQQLEWTHGANPLGICLVTGRSSSAPYPHTRYVGLIHGAVMNGITGDAQDVPHLGGSNYDFEWQTLEYWSPQQANYLMCLSELHDSFEVKTDIGLRYPNILNHR